MNVKFNISKRSGNKLITIIMIYITVLIAFRSLIRQWSLIYGIGVILISLMAFYSIKRNRTLVFKKNRFSFLLCLTIFPMLYNNYYFKIGEFSYIIIIIFIYLFILFSECEKIDAKVLNNIGLIISIISIFFAVITWICFFSDSFYYNQIVPVFPSTTQAVLIDYYKNYGMLAGLTDHYSRNAYYIMLGCMLLIINLKNSNHKLLSILSIIFLFSTLLLVGKRGHLIFFMISLIVAYYIEKGFTVTNFIKNNAKIIMFFIAMLIIINIIPGTDNFLYRLLNVTGSNFTNGRINLYSIAIEMLNESYWLGLGWGSFVDRVNFQYAGVHNDYLQLLCETGIWGFLIFIFFQLHSLNKSIVFLKNNINYKLIRSICVFSIAFQVFFILYSFTGIPHYDYEVYVVYLIATSIPWIINTQNDNIGVAR